MGNWGTKRARFDSQTKAQTMTRYPDHNGNADVGTEKSDRKVDNQDQPTSRCVEGEEALAPSASSATPEQEVPSENCKDSKSRRRRRRKTPKRSDCDQYTERSQRAFWWRVTSVVMGLILACMVLSFVLQLRELWDLPRLANEYEMERPKTKNPMAIRKEKDIGDIGANPYEIVLPAECIRAKSALPEDNEPCRAALTKVVNPAMRRAYRTDGVLAIRGLLTQHQISILDSSSDELLEIETEKKGGAKKARSRKGNQFYTDRSGALFLDPNESVVMTTSKEETCATEVSKECQAAVQGEGTEGHKVGSDMSAFRGIALMSAVPLVAAELMGLDATKNETLRVIRDIFLAKDEGEYVCGFHVDDHGFWPAAASSPGINAWIAVDDIPPDLGGTFALAVGSHSASWKMEAHEAIGSVLTYPEQGFEDAKDMVQNRPGKGTCNLKTAAPVINQKMEESKRIYDLRQGDVIFHERWLFHRTVPFDREAVHYQKLRQWGYKGGYEKNPPKPLMKRRYSIRYGPGSSTVIRGWGTEPSVLWDEQNTGKTVDEVSQSDEPWYPKAWPGLSSGEMKSLSKFVEEKLTMTEQRKNARMRELKDALRK